MKNLHFLLCPILLTLSFAAHAGSIKIPTPTEFLGGKALCSNAVNAPLIKHEQGFYTIVPVDYANPAAGQFDLYSWFQGGFDAKKPTLVYLTGGPGMGTHWGQGALMGEYNLLLVDQRGIACSRPRTYKDYLSPTFYSSKNIALDIEELRKSLKIEKWSVYGVSYGTMPATIYGSMFPERTTSVILEGVTFDAETLWKHDRRKDLILAEIKKQTIVIQNRIKNLQYFEVESAWFFSWAKDQMLMNEGRADLGEKLQGLADIKDFESFVKMLQESYGPPKVEYPRNELYLLNEVPYYMLACQEMGVLNYKSEIAYNSAGEIVEAFNPDIFQNCSKIKAMPKALYTALDYPLSVPTFYFQGENDSATEVQGSLNHYRKVAQGPKQFFLLSEGGHNPNLQILRDENVGEQGMMLNAVNGILSSDEVVEKANSEIVGMKWAVVE